MEFVLRPLVGWTVRSHPTLVGCPMKTQFLTAALILTACCGCKSSSPLLSWMGHDDADKLAAQSANDSSQDAKLPPPTNVNPRNASLSVSSLDEHLQLGESELNLRRFPQARTHFESVLNEQPQHVKANHRMGVLCDKLGEYDTAERHYRLALINNPQDVSILSDLGYSYWLQGRYSDSERLLLQARQVDPQYKNAIANLGMLYGTTGRPQEALAMFRQIGDEAAAQEIMQQVAAMAPQSAAPAVSGGSMSPVTLADHEAQPSRDPSRVDLDSVDDRTRKVLELMEEGRWQRELAEQERANSLASRQQQVPPFVQNRAATQQGYSPQMAGVDPFRGQPGRTAEQPRIPDAMLSQALANIDRHGRRAPSDRPITLGPNTNSSQSNVPAYGASQSSVPQYNTPPPTGYPAPNHLASTGGPQQGIPVFTGSSQPSQAQPRFNTNPSPQPPYSTTGSVPQFDPGMAAQPQQPVANQYASFEPARPAAQQGSSSIITYGNPHRNPSQAGMGYPTQPTQSMGPPASQSFSTASTAGMPHSNGVRQASGFVQQQGDSLATGQHGFGPSPVEHAHHQQQPGVQTPIDLLSASAQPNNTPPTPVDTSAPATPGSQWPLIPSGTANPNDPYQQARRQAALMGLEAGPGQMFPYVHQTQRAAPGASSLLNGAQYPPPQRQLPYGMNPADLAPSFAAPQATNLTPGQNFQGQHLPQVAAPINTPTQFGAPASRTFQQYQQPGYEAQPATTYTQPYEDIRQQHAQQLNGLIDQTYGQPVQTPPSGIAAMPSQTYHAPHGPPPTQYSTPQTGTNEPTVNTTPPPRWTPPQLTAPTTQSTRPTQYDNRQSYNTTQPTTSNTSPGIVVPEQYPAAVNSGYQTNSTYQQTPAHTLSRQQSGGLPVIVPGER